MITADGGGARRTTCWSWPPAARRSSPPVRRDAELAIPFRTLDDCHRILRGGRTRGAAAVVLGGGLLGLEAARGLAGRGLPVTLVHLAGHLMERQLDAEAGLVLGETLTELGVDIRTGVVGRGDRREDRAYGWPTARWSTADLVVLACGVRPVTGLPPRRAWPYGGASSSTTSCAPSDPAVFAIGECAEHDGTVYGLVAPAWEQAAVAADVHHRRHGAATGARGW